MVFRVIPAVDLKAGRCVQLVQGVPGSEMVSLPPLEAAQRWIEEGADVLHLVDLDGAIGGVRVNQGLIEQIVRDFGVEAQVGGGIRSWEDAAALLESGVSRVILGTVAVENPSLVERLVGEFGGERVMAALDCRDGRVTLHGWRTTSAFTPEELGGRLQDVGVGSILFTNINTEGLLQGVDVAPVERLTRALEVPVVASGGVTSLADITALKNVGASGVVVGSALYLGKFSLREALELEV